MSGELDSSKNSHSTKFKWRPQIFVKLHFRDWCGSKLSCLHPFDNVAIIHWVKTRLKTERLWIHEMPILVAIFVSLTENSSVVTNDTLGRQKYPHSRNSCREILPWVTGNKNYHSIFNCWWRSVLVITSQSGLLTILQHSITRKHLFLYPQGERSGKKKQKNDKRQH